MKLVFVILFQSLALFVWAKDKPDWTSVAAKSDSEYKYYVGRASAVAGESNAISQATRDAYEQAHRENFGSEVQINSESYQTNTSALSIARVSEKSKSARFEGFEQKDFYIEDTGDGRFNAWVLYSFAVSAISKEQNRLKNLPDMVAQAPAFSVQGSSNEASKGVLQVSTDPQAAVVYVDGERYGKTPLQLNGQLEIGSHLLRLDHPQYETFEEEVIIGTNKTTSVERTLVRSSGLLKINVDIPNASVMVNGQPVGITPIKDEIKVEAGVPHKVQITHAETEKYSQEVNVNKGDSRVLDVTLPKKPSYLSLDTMPTGAMVKIDGKDQSTPLQKLQLKPRSYKIEITRDGFLPVTQELTLLGGEVKTLPLIALTPLSVEEKRLQTSPMKINFGLGYLGSSVKEGESQISYNISFEKKFFGWVGIRISYDYAVGGDKTKVPESRGSANSSSTITIDQTSKIISASLPIYFYERYYIAPEVGTAKTTIGQRTGSYNGFGVLNSTVESTAEFNQSFTGAFIGHEWISSGGNKTSWSLELGVRSYSTVEGYKNAQPFLFKWAYTLNY